MASRRLSDAERELFESAVGDSAPPGGTRHTRKKSIPHKAPSEKPTTKEPDRVQGPQRHERRRIGIDGNTADRLRRGQIEPQARLDLHGMYERDAHRALVTFVRAASARQLRLLLVVTGKGGAKRTNRKTDEFDLGLDMHARGILRSLTPRWLREPGLAELIADVREAHRRHGGAGAIYVYLRKSERR